MKFILSTTLFATALFLFTGPLDAKERTCRIAALERPQGVPRVVYLFDGKKNHRVALPGVNLSPVIELRRGELTLTLSPSEITDPDTLPPHVSTLQVARRLSDFYILIAPDPKNKKFPVGIKLIDAGGGKLKQGETLWSNLTPHKVMAKLGNTKAEILPKAQIVSKAPVAKSGHYKAIFTYQANGKGAVAPITEQSWWHDTNSKHLGFITNTGGRLPKIYFFRDFR